MAHEDIVFNGKDFATNLTDHILIKDIIGSGEDDFRSSFFLNSMFTIMDEANAYPGGTPITTQTGVIDFFTSFNIDNNPIVRWDTFCADYIKKLALLKFPVNIVAGVDTNLAARNTFLSAINPSSTLSNVAYWTQLLTQGLVRSYRFILQMGGAGVGDDHINAPLTGYWAEIDALLPAAKKIDVERQAIDAFNHFAEQYTYDDSGTFAGASNIFKNWGKFLSVTSLLNKDPSYTGINSAGDPVPIPNFPSYEEVFKGFFGTIYFDESKTAAENDAFMHQKFIERLAKFFLDKTNVSNEGAALYFIPSHFFDEWNETLRAEYIIANIISSVDDGSADGLLVIDRILRLLVEMVGIMQRVTAAQAQRLNFLTAWQKAYTDLLNQVPTFTVDDGSPIGGSDETTTKNRGEVNTAMQAIAEKIRAKRSAVQDEAKQLQSTINQSQDASNQQVQMATSLLQQLSTILSQIYR